MFDDNIRRRRRALPMIIDAGETPWYLAGGVPAANCIAAYKPIGAASLAASYINLANPGTYNAAPGVAPTWNATDGWIGNGATTYLTTGVSANQQTYTMIVRFSNVTANSYPCGWNKGANERFAILIRPVTNNDIDYRYVADNIVAPAITSGTLAMGSNKGWRNGVAEAFTVTPGSSTGTVYVLAHSAPAASGFFAGNIQAFALYNTGLSAAQMLAIHTAMMALTP